MENVMRFGIKALVTLMFQIQDSVEADRTGSTAEETKQQQQQQQQLHSWCLHYYTLNLC